MNIGGKKKMLQLTNKTLTIKLDESKMEITSLKLGNLEFLYQKTNDWQKDFPTLFPICGTLIDNKYLVNHQEYHLNRHGFFREIKN
jgi:galactose mutarotase-like enzyme